MVRALGLLFFTLAVMTPRLATASTIVYQWDDGTQGGRVAPSPGSTFYFIQAFDVLPGAESILGIQARWGAELAAVAGELFLWIDPTDDGVLTDLEVLRALQTTVPVYPNTGPLPSLNNLPVLEYFFATPVVLPVGSTFHVGVSSYRSTNVPTMWVGTEHNLPITGFYTGSFAGQHTGGDLTDGDFRTIFPAQDIAIRAIGGPTPVPEPASLLLFGVGAAAVAAKARRRRRRKGNCTTITISMSPGLRAR